PPSLPPPPRPRHPTRDPPPRASPSHNLIGPFAANETDDRDVEGARKTDDLRLLDRPPHTGLDLRDRGTGQRRNPDGRALVGEPLGRPTALLAEDLDPLSNAPRVCPVRHRSLPETSVFADVLLRFAPS